MRFAFVFALLFPFVAAAQEKPKKRFCRILFLNPPASAPAKLFLFDGTASQEVQLPEMNFSPVYELPSGERTLSLVPKAVTKPEELPAGAPSAKVSEAMLDFYLILSSDPANKVAPVRIQLIEADEQKFKRGQMMWYNLTPNSIGGNVGSQKLAMKPQSSTVMDEPTPGAGQYDVALAFMVPGDQKVHPICQTKWLHDPRSRMVMFVYGGSATIAPEVAGFQDFREPERKPQ